MVRDLIRKFEMFGYVTDDLKGNAYSPDLNPCDSFLWGHMKDLVYKKKPTDLISLKRFITDSFVNIKRKTLELVTDNFVTRLRYCIISDGSHFENILH
ncbi:hypothetical protein AVEN_105622-1 [Araneus ventricosus]|uniref:Uncharacterized protein n=1 Tax=Araneus ventricosus TaxID=182803 RepID=A0A4Y2MMR1_ARAVE|nr:hypothetical protein AVEN_226574-1 [Araneus ventricosus]GBN27974.1 hypothetical protein AVEN_244498-1 [Araneus ventricosus]GBN27992.1 hypothetical protein AVEN_270651-1 [Araneus ventricosus]GBN28024.1 hypothetical protein AVEN_105622-1 [Araneus ventricosus]